MMRLWWAQTVAVLRLEMAKTFLSRRGLWVYLLAFAPAVLFGAHSFVEIYWGNARGERLARVEHKITAEDFGAVQEGMKTAQVQQILGDPMFAFTRNHGDTTRETRRYTDGRSEFLIVLEDGAVTEKREVRRGGHGLGEDSRIFAGVFQFFYLRLAIFFGCLGIFVNLFRGEMLGKSIHYYLLAPMRREVLVAAKYLAGVLASVVIFGLGTIAQIVAMYFHYKGPQLEEYFLRGGGLSQSAAYVGVTALACVGYGAVFLTAGLVFRNPMITGALILIWESINPFLPELMKKASVIYYLRALCPVDVPVEPGTPALFALLISNTNPVSAAVAVLGLTTVAAVLLVIGARRARTLEINYSTE